MLSVSGIVPDGVAAAFLTAPDGTAVRADVQDNAYTFVVAPSKAPEQRHVVWTGGDGTPHVQPLPASVSPARLRCALTTRIPTVSPDPFTTALATPAIRLLPARPRPPWRHR